MAHNTGSDESGQATPASDKVDGDSLSETRREAVRRLGKYAAYTAPALLVLLTATASAAAS